LKEFNCSAQGHYLRVTPAMIAAGSPEIKERAYWEMDFPDLGDEDHGGDPRKLVDDFEKVMLESVAKRLRADVPVGAYLSGGVDSSMIVALACHLKGPAINTYTIRVNSPELDELDAANLVAKHIGTKAPIVQEFTDHDAVNNYPRLIGAAEAPVIDTSCAALLQLAQRVHQNGQKVVLTGEGADEWLVGYPWYKVAKALSYLDLLPGLRVSDRLRRAYLRFNNVPQYPREMRAGLEEMLGGPNAWIDSYGLLGLSKLRFYAEPMREILATQNPWADLQMPLERAKRWHPLNRGIWVAARVTLAGASFAGKRRSRRHAFFRRSALSVPRRRCVRLHCPSPSALEAARASGTNTCSACSRSAGFRRPSTNVAR
jgi:asparagine synthase (glutamine-hydrolysing)